MSYKLSYKDKSNVEYLLSKLKREDKTKERGEIISQISDELKINWFEISAYLGHDPNLLPFESTANTSLVEKIAIETK